MKLDAEAVASYGYSEHVSKVACDSSKKQFPSDILKLDDGCEKIEEDVMLHDAIESKDCIVKNPIKNNKNERSYDLFYMDKTVTDVVKLQHLSVSTNASPNVKDICIDEGVQTLDKIFSSPSIDKIVRNDLRSFLINEYYIEQCYSDSSISERRRLDTTEMNVCTLPSEENNCIAGNNDQFEEEKTAAFFVTSSTEARNSVMNNQQNVQSQNGVGIEEHISDKTASAPNSFSHIATNGDFNLLGPTNLSATITTSSSHIPYSGSISLRSETSTTSAQSFAFPLLQPEWSSSPIRMAKADRRHKRKNGWKTVLICCKF